MKKYIIYIVLIVLSITSLQGQEDREHGFYLGADRDTLEYIVASPFDNWFMSVGIGGQTFIGNEVEDTARWNSLDFKAYLEIGKWLIPDMAVSVWMSYYTLTSQSVYGLNPYIDYDYHVLHPNEYLPFKTNAFAIGGLVTLDWTNLFNGYEKGLLKKWRFMTPIGLGFGVNWGQQVSTNPKFKRDGYEVGDLRRNFELYYTAAFLVEYAINPKIRLDFSARFVGTRGSYDYSSYANNKHDMMPSITAGVRFNLLKHVTKVDARTGRSILNAVVFHEFQPASNDRVTILTNMIDSLRTVVKEVEGANADNAANAINAANAANAGAIIALNQQIDSLKNLLDEEKMDLNPMAQIDITATELDLPMARVYFELDRYDLDYNARKILHNFALQIKNDTTDNKYYIIGAADAQTGSVSHNQKLSENRCLAVYKVLVNGYGISKDKLKYFPLGGITEYEPKEYNRTCIMVQSDSKLTEIIYKWTFENN